jgi:hypothetical protein
MPLRASTESARSRSFVASKIVVCDLEAWAEAANASVARRPVSRAANVRVDLTL